HLVEPLPGPCLSLNPTVYCATFQDLLRWLVDELSTQDACRASIPGEAGEQEAILARLESMVSSSLVPETIARFRTFLSNEMEFPTRVNLPSIANAQQGLTARSIVRIRNGRIVHVTSDESSSSFRIRWKSKDVHFSFEHLPVFLSLNDGNGHTV